MAVLPMLERGLHPIVPPAHDRAQPYSFHIRRALVLVWTSDCMFGRGGLVEVYDMTIMSRPFQMPRSEDWPTNGFESHLPRGSRLSPNFLASNSLQSNRACRQCPVSALTVVASKVQPAPPTPLDADALAPVGFRVHPENLAALSRGGHQSKYSPLHIGETRQVLSSLGAGAWEGGEVLRVALEAGLDAAGPLFEATPHCRTDLASVTGSNVLDLTDWQVSKLPLEVITS